MSDDDLTRRLRDRYPDDPDVQALIDQAAASSAIAALYGQMLGDRAAPAAMVESRPMTALRPIQAGQLVTAEDVEG